jgi:hypothetical protein
MSCAATHRLVPLQQLPCLGTVVARQVQRGARRHSHELGRAPLWWYRIQDGPRTL